MTLNISLWTSLSSILAGLVFATALGEEIGIRARVEASPPAGGYYPWYEIHADPDNAANLMICGSRWDAGDDAFYGYVYTSSDGGRSWRVALEDQNSRWVTEHSCAFGTGGEAYFVSEASTGGEGRLGGDTFVTRIYFSGDSGLSWTEAGKTGQMDYSQSVVDTAPGRNENRLYIAFNEVFDSQKTAAVGLPQEGGYTAIGLRSFRNGDKEIGAPISNSAVQAPHYQGSFPQKLVVLRDGSLLSLYFAGSDSAQVPTSVLGAVHTDTARSRLSAPVNVARASVRSMRIHDCYLYDFAMTYDAAQNRVYLVYKEVKAGQCVPVLATSVDGGATWSKSRLNQVGKPGQHYYALAMALNRYGILGLLWRGRPSEDCWYFAASRDLGRRFGRAQPLSQCSGQPLSLSSTFLAVEHVVHDPSKPESARELSAPGLHVIDHKNATWRNTSALVAAWDGVFHPVWNEAGRGEGELRTAAVTVGEPVEKTLPDLPFDVRAGCDVTDHVAVLYGGNQFYDLSSETLTEKIVLKNNRKQPLSAPLLLKAATLTGGSRGIEAANSRNGATGAGAIWDLSESLPGGVLQPGEMSLPYPLMFHIAPRTKLSHLTDEGDVLDMKIEVLTAPRARGCSK